MRRAAARRRAHADLRRHDASAASLCAHAARPDPAADAGRGVALRRLVLADRAASEHRARRRDHHGLGVHARARSSTTSDSPRRGSSPFRTASSRASRRVDDARGAPARACAVPPAARLLLFVGIASPRKNLDRLVRAFGALTDSERGDAHLVLAGPRRMEERRARRRARREPDRRTGFAISGSWRTRTCRRSTVSRGASRTSRAVRASACRRSRRMACGAPLVCADRTSFPEVVGDAALLVDPDDDAAVVRALAAILAGGPDVAARRRAGSSGHAASPGSAPPPPRWPSTGASCADGPRQRSGQSSSGLAGAVPEPAAPRRRSRAAGAASARAPSASSARMPRARRARAGARVAAAAEQRDQHRMPRDRRARQRHQTARHRRARPERPLMREEGGERRAVQMRDDDRRVEEEDAAGSGELVVERQLLGAEAHRRKRRRRRRAPSRRKHTLHCGTPATIARRPPAA